MTVAFRSAQSAANGAAPTSITVSRPAGVVDADALVAFVVISADQTITAAPAGWTLLGEETTGTATGDCRHAVYWKSASSEPASWTWSFSGGADVAATVLAYTGVSLSAPVNVSAATRMVGSTVTHTAPSVTPSAAGTFTIFAFGVNPVYNGDTTFSTPSGLTFRVEADPGAGTTNRAVIKVFDKSTPTASATGTKQTTINNSAKGVAWSVSVASQSVQPLTVTVGPSRTTSGCMLGWYDVNGYSSTNGVEDMETILGTHFAAIRVYNKWWPDISSTTTSAIADGRLVLVSHKPPKHANAWIEIADGVHDSDISDMVAYYKALDVEIVFIFHHEPHDQSSDLKNGNYGRSSDFVAAFRRIAKAFTDANATKVRIGYCAVANTWANKGTPIGTGDKCYPGDDVVDVLCHDDYNWFRHDDPTNWDSMETVMADTVAIAVRLDKPIIFGEIGCQRPAGTKSRDDWFRDGAAWLKSDPDASRYVIGFCYYHVDNHLNSGFYWRFAQGAYTGGRQGYIDGLSSDSYFLTEPIPVAPSQVGDTVNAAGIASRLKIGKPTLAAASGPATVVGVGAIPSPADYQDPEESPGLDFGAPTMGVAAAGVGAVTSGLAFGTMDVFEYGRVSPTGIASQIVFGTLTVTHGAGPGSIFIPPIRYLNPPILPSSRGAPRRLFRYYDARPVGVNVYVMNDGTVTERPTDLNAIATTYHGGHEIPISDAEAAVLVAAGYGGDITPDPIGTDSIWGDYAGSTWGELAGYRWSEL